jgi:hypothetical protein
MNLHILQHSLGIDQYGQGRQYRNHFVTGPGSKDWDDCRALVEAGLMVERLGNILSGGDSIFVVTPAGIEHVAMNSPKPPRVSRSQKRYQRFREYGDGFSSFLDFCRWDAAPERSWNAR